MPDAESGAGLSLGWSIRAPVTWWLGRIGPKAYPDCKIYHLIERSDWERAENRGTGVFLREGETFLHCCDERQLKTMGTGYFPASTDLVVLVLDPTQLKDETRYEPGSAGESERFPHLYGPIRPHDVVRVEPVDFDQT